LPFLVMELLAGRTLQEALDQDGVLALDRAIGIAVQVLDGLAAAHAAGIVHRDLKPANVFVMRDPDSGGDFVKLLDFGISKIRSGNASQITNTGVVMGTPIFMAPEQFRSARDVDGRADVYASSVVFYLMLSGKVPFKGDTYEEMLVKISTETPASLSVAAPRVPLAIAQVVDRGLARDRDARWQTAEEYALALRMAAGGEQTPVMRPVMTHRGTQSMGRPAGTAPSAPPSSMPTPIGDTTPRGGADPYGPTAYTPPGATPPVTVPRHLPAPVTASSIPDTLMSKPPASRSAPPHSVPRQPPWVSGPGVPYAQPALTPSRAEVTPIAVSATIPEGPRGRSWLWLLLLAPVAAVIGAGIVLGIMALVTRGDPAPVAPPQMPVPQQQQPLQFQPQPMPQQMPQQMPQPAWPQQQVQPMPPGQARPPAPQVEPPPAPQVEPPPSPAQERPAAPAGPTSITIHEPFTVGDVNDAAIHDVLRRARPGMAECRATEPVRVRVQFFVDGDGISLAGPDHENPGPADVARCIASRIRIAVPDGWQPGDGIVKIDVDLPAAP
jgi:serine/threonine-protein kinase